MVLRSGFGVKNVRHKSAGQGFRAEIMGFIEVGVEAPQTLNPGL